MADSRSGRLEAGVPVPLHAQRQPSKTIAATSGFVYAKPEDVTHEVLGASCGRWRFTIPPNDANHQVTAPQMFSTDTVLLGMNPHMHLRGKSFRYEVQYCPTASAKCCSTCRRYDFNWQLWYMLKEPKPIPKGSRMICTAYFDNSADNPGQSRPDRTGQLGRANLGRNDVRVLLGHQAARDTRDVVRIVNGGRVGSDRITLVAGEFVPEFCQLWPAHHVSGRASASRQHHRESSRSGCSPCRRHKSRSRSTARHSTR